MKSLLRNKNGDVSLVMQAIVISITMVMGIIITYAVIGGVSVTTIDKQVATSMGRNGAVNASNATKNIVSNVNTFFQIAPIMIVVIAAVGILSYLFILRQKGA